MAPVASAYHRRVEANTQAIVRLAWSRLLGLPDDTLDPAANPVRVVRSDTADDAMVVRLWDTWVVRGPGWFHDRTADADPAALVDPGTLLRTCAGHPARLVGHAVLGFTDRYAEPSVPGSVALEDVPVDDAPAAAAALERACPPDDVREVGLAEMGRLFVTLDDRDQPTSGAGYDEWQGLLGHLGVLTPPELRGSGWGTVAAALALNDALDVGLVAQWRARTDNAASRRVARRLGFAAAGEQSTVTLG
ncbi:hypothetical protein GCM10009714_26210 [Microlunatus capsulatus]